MHTGEDITITYKRDGRYDDAALEKLNWFLRDWRRSEQTRMDPHLIDLVWEVQREAGAERRRSRSCAATARRRPTPCCATAAAASRVTASTCSATPWTSTFPACRSNKLREIGLRLAARRRRLLSGVRLALRAYGHRRHPHVAAHVARAIGARVPRRPHRADPERRQAVAGLCAGARRYHESAAIRRRRIRSTRRALPASMSVRSWRATNARRHNPFAKLLGLAKDGDEEDDAARVTPVAAVAMAAQPPARHPVIAAIEHGARTAEKATAKAAIKVADAASKVKFIRTRRRLAVAFLPAGTRRECSNRRRNRSSPRAGYWQGVADSAAGTAARPTPEATGSIGPFADPHDTQGAPELALAYADQPSRDTLGIAALRAAALSTLATQHPVETSTTIAVKRADDQATSAVMTASATSLTVDEDRRCASDQSVDARDRAVAQRAQLPHHARAGRARLPLARAHDGETARARC